MQRINETACDSSIGFPKIIIFQKWPNCDYAGAYVAQENTASDTLKSRGKQFGRVSITRKLIEKLPSTFSLIF